MRDNPIAAYQRDTSTGDALVDEYAPLVNRIAHHLVARLPDSVLPDDLIQAGMLGLLEAAANFDGTRGAAFETYAGIRVRGAMIDEMRRGDWAPRSVHRQAREIAQAISAVEARSKRPAQEQEIAAELGITIDAYHQRLADTQSCRLFSFEQMIDEEGYAELPGAGDNPTDEVERANFKQRLVEAIEQLGEREQLIFALYYDECLNLKEIGAVLGVSESRVSQLMTQATLRLRSLLTDWVG